MNCGSFNFLHKNPLSTSQYRANPYGEHYLDGISLNPFEVMFVKVKGRLLDSGWSFAAQAAKYTEIMKGQVRMIFVCWGAYRYI